MMEPPSPLSLTSLPPLPQTPSDSAFPSAPATSSSGSRSGHSSTRTEPPTFKAGLVRSPTPLSSTSAPSPASSSRSSPRVSHTLTSSPPTSTVTSPPLSPHSSSARVILGRNRGVSKQLTSNSADSDSLLNAEGKRASTETSSSLDSQLSTSPNELSSLNIIISPRRESNNSQNRTSVVRSPSVLRRSTSNRPLPQAPRALTSSGDSFPSPRTLLSRASLHSDSEMPEASTTPPPPADVPPPVPQPPVDLPPPLPFDATILTTQSTISGISPRLESPSRQRPSRVALHMGPTTNLPTELLQVRALFSPSVVLMYSVSGPLT